MKIDFYYDFISPFSYLAALRIGALSEKTGAEIAWRPINLPRLIKLSGNAPPGSVPNKGRYLIRDLKRKAKRLQVPLKLIRPGAFDSRPALYAACALAELDRQRFSLGLFRSIWSGEINVQKPDWLQVAVVANGLPEQWLAYDVEAQKQALQSNTEQALARGAFGAPSFVLHRQQRRELFFGVDHMGYLAQACLESA